MDPRMGGVCQAVRTIINATEIKNTVYNEVVSLDSPQASFLSTDPIIIHALGPAKGPWSYSNKLLPWLLNSIRNFDIVIVHGLWQYHTFAMRKALEGYQQNTYPFKIFLMPHGMLDPYFQKAKDRRFKALRNTVFWKLIENKLVSQIDGLLFTSEDELLLARKPFKPYSPKNEQVVGLGIVPPPAFVPNMKKSFLSICPAVSDKKFILFLGRIDTKKGVDLLIDAYDKLCNDVEYLHNIPELVIAGPGLDSKYGQMIQKQIANLPSIRAKVHFTGMLSGDAKWGAYYSCSAFILPSHQENFGISVVESLACSKPVLISNKINIWREIDTMHAGIVDEDTVEGTYTLLKKWCSLSDDEMSSMSKNSYECFKKYFVAEQTAERLLNFFSTYE